MSGKIKAILNKRRSSSQSSASSTTSNGDRSDSATSVSSGVSNKSVKAKDLNLPQSGAPNSRFVLPPDAGNYRSNGAETDETSESEEDEDEEGSEQSEEDEQDEEEPSSEEEQQSTPKAVAAPTPASDASSSEPESEEEEAKPATNGSSGKRNGVVAAGAGLAGGAAAAVGLRNKSNGNAPKAVSPPTSESEEEPAPKAIAREPEPESEPEEEPEPEPIKKSKTRKSSVAAVTSKSRSSGRSKRTSSRAKDSSSESEVSEPEEEVVKPAKKSSRSRSSRDKPKSSSRSKRGEAALAGVAAGAVATEKSSHDREGRDKSKKRSSAAKDKGPSVRKSKSARHAEAHSDDEIPRHVAPKVLTPEEHGVHRQKLGKPYNKLTMEDVKLDEEGMRKDIDDVWISMHLFMNSRMKEAEAICLTASDHRMYFSVGYSLIQCIKSLMTFEPDDLANAVSRCKETIIIADKLRKTGRGVTEGFAKLVTGSSTTKSLKLMTVIERHAELVWAESVLLKAVLGIIYSGDFMAFLKEALNMRSAYSVYRTLAEYIEQCDAAQPGRGAEDPALDQDFRSGVYLGNGLISLVLSLLPSTVLAIMEVFGFTGDRAYALKMLMRGGKWSADPKNRKPGMTHKNEGIRRQICDMALLLYHLVISTYLPVGMVDIDLADKVLHYNLKRYPNGVFFLFFSGRLYSAQTMGEKALRQYSLAIASQDEYVQIEHICHWDRGLTYLSLGKYAKAYTCFDILGKDSNWSKSVYAYAKAISLYEADPVKHRDDIMKSMRAVPDLMQRIAGKSIPLEKYVARKSKQFLAQGGRLACPGIELAYFLNALSMAPRYALFGIHLRAVSETLAKLHDCKDPSSYGETNTEGEYWDDYCMAHFLRAIILRFIAFPEKHTHLDPEKSPISKKEAADQALISLNNVYKHGTKITTNHMLVWFAHYEMGRVYDDLGDPTKAKAQYDIVMAGKKMEIDRRGESGKVSLQNMSVLRTNAARDKLIARQKGKAAV
ncbi:uncharacterized protein L969DRAFT_87758 [Mixia osmundae IAM 14324]|nr:uncharacterized protein L969DRAFT_87758 [Mixia osmundae IAM 14324]KEI39752.1 hypothetical protein L969DRAFT_87758 [Mixia osmundae IAM 14324]